MVQFSSLFLTAYVLYYVHAQFRNSESGTIGNVGRFGNNMRRDSVKGFYNSLRNNFENQDDPNIHSRISNLIGLSPELTTRFSGNSNPTLYQQDQRNMEKLTVDANNYLQKEVTDGDVRYNGKSEQEGQDDRSVQDLLKSFESDDTRGNYFHHGQHGDYQQTPGAFQEDLLRHETENPETRQVSFNSPDLLVTKEVELFLQYGNVPLGRILIGLFGDTVPKTVMNFVDLADQKVSSHFFKTNGCH